MSEIRPIKHRIKVDYVFTPKDRRLFDISNKIESINDLMVDLGIIEDDNYKFLLIGDTTVLHCNKEECGCEVITHKINNIKI